MPKPENIIPPKKGERRNPNGRPKKLLSSINSELQAKGYEKVTPSQIQETYSYMLALPLDELKAMIEDSDTPMIMRIMGREMLNQKRAPEIIEIMLSRAHGKPTQHNKQEVSGKIETAIDFSSMTNEQLLEIINRGGE